MFDAKKLLDQFLGSQIPSDSDMCGTGPDTQLAKNTPLVTGAIAAAIFSAKTGREVSGNVAIVAGLWVTCIQELLFPPGAGRFAAADLGRLRIVAAITILLIHRSINDHQHWI